ncbi:MAG TPA: class I SAM-dependent methyltransferase [Anaerolineales bacterium]|nr:class I SAM-dependent methyltransferase [Anaerolineales bacterium]
MARQEFYDLWYKTRRPQWDTGQSPPKLLEFITTHPPGRALDLGCGTGTNVITLAKAGWQATGVDFASQAIKLARQKALAEQVDARFRVGDVTRVRFPAQSFDMIMDWGCFQGLEKGRETYLKNVFRWLTPGGFFLLYSLKHQPDIVDFGLCEADLALFSAFTLECREDGHNSGPVTRPSLWLEFMKPI